MQLHIQETVTEQDSHHHIEHPFAVPEGATRIDINFQYEPKRAGRYGNLLTLSLFDPLRERGTGHRGQPTQQVRISAFEATPGYLAGPLISGEWVLMVNTNLINAGSAVTYTIDIAVSFYTDQAVEPASWSPGKTAPRGPGWYRGDLHAHTFHSDGSWDVDGLVQFARDNRLDFVTLTDHNTVSALSQMDSRSADDLLTMGGFELTTFYGHALALGLREILEWRVRADERTMTDIYHEVCDRGGLFVIAHPMCPGDPVCTGCQWEYPDMMPGSAQVVEVWNEHWASGSNNAGSVALWYEWLNQGHQLAATVGTDIHGPKPGIEFAFDVVYAEELSEQAILAAVRKGHLYLSSGPELAFTGASATGQQAMVGDSLEAGPYTLDLQWANCRAGDVMRLIVDGDSREETAVAAGGAKSWSLTGKHWCLIEIRDSEGGMRALTNPIFLSA